MATPGAISTLAAKAVATDRVRLTFGSSVGATSYQERHGLHGSNTWTTPAATSTGRHVSGLTAATAYDFEVRGENIAGDGAWSSIASATTFAVAVLTPPAPEAGSRPSGYGVGKGMGNRRG